MSTPSRYGIALAASTTACLSRGLFGPLIMPSPFVPAFAAVLLSAWCGGFLPGIFSAAVSVVTTLALFLPPVWSWDTGWPTVIRAGLFAAVACLASWVAAVARAQRDDIARRVEERTQELERANRRLTGEISARKDVETALRQSEERFRALIENSSDMVVVIGADRHVRYTSPSLRRILGYESTELAGRDGFRIVHPDDTAATVAQFNELLHGQSRALSLRYRLRHKNGSWCWIEGIAANLLDEPSIRGIIVNARDITQRKQVEDALRENEARFRTLAETVAAAIFIFQGTALRYVNRAAIAITGYSESELLAMSFWAIIHPDFRGLVRERGEARQRGEPVSSHYEVKICTKSGEGRWVDFNGAVITFDGAPAVLGTAFDVTERKRAEEEIRQRQAELAHVLRVSTMGEMAAGLAHEINQPLSAIVNYAKGCAVRVRSGMGSPQELADTVEEIAAEAVRAAEIVRRLRQFVRKEPPRRQWVDVNELVVEAACLVAADAARHGINIDWQLAPGVPAVRADRIQIEQVVLNILRNGIEAMSAQGSEHPLLAIRVALTREGAVEVAIRDYGEGLGSKDPEQIFRPFFTTKAGGLGLGLSISRSIVEAHGGRLWAAAEPGGGVTFRFTLPPIESAVTHVQ